MVANNETERLEAERKELEDLGDSFYDLKDYFELNRIFISNEMSLELKELIDSFNNKLVDYRMPKDLAKQGLSPSDLKEENKKSHEAAKYIQKEIPQKLRIIENNFRELLNVKSIV